MTTLPSTIRWATALAVALLLMGGGLATAQETSAYDLPLTLRAFAVNMSGVGNTRAGTIDITIERWSTDEERQMLLDQLIEKNSKALLDALQKIRPRAGFVRTSTSIGWDIYYARLHPLAGGGNRIVFATDRPMSMWELQNQPRSTDYEFMLCEIHMGTGDKGTGKLASMAKVTWNKETRSLEIENYGIEPVRLQDVQIVK
jgi:hypothetical protein